MDAFRTSNTSYIRHSGFVPADEDVPNNTDVRIQYEQQQVRLIQVLKVLGVLFLVLSLPFFYNLFRFGGITNECGQRQSVASTLVRPFYWLFGIKQDTRCKKDTSTDFKADDNFTYETTTETTTCLKGAEAEDNILKNLIGGDHDYLAHLPSAGKTERTVGKGYGDEEDQGSFWDYFSLPSFACSDFNRHTRQLNELEPSVTFFKRLMPSLEEASRNAQAYAKTLGDVSKLPPINDADKAEAREWFARILSPTTQWKTADESQLPQLAKKPLEWLLNNKNVFSVQKLVADWKKSRGNLDRKNAYVNALKDTTEALPQNAERCSGKLLGIEGQLNEQNGRLSGLLADKSGLENQIQENQLKLNAFVSQRNTKEQEPINIVRQLEAELQELKYKVNTIPGIRSDLEARQKVNRKSEDTLTDLRGKLDADGKNALTLEADVSGYQREIDILKRQIEANKIKLAMRRMKLQLANSNRAIKEHLMSLIKTNNGEPVDFEVLFSSSENARKEIKRILREFIKESAGSHIEINISETQIDEIINKDQKEFDEIRRIYTELVAIINQYGDFNIYITGIAKDIKDLEGKLTADDRQIGDLLKKIRDAKAVMEAIVGRKRGFGAEIERLETLIADNNRYIREKEAEINRWQDDYDKLKLRKDLYVQEHKVG